MQDNYGVGHIHAVHSQCNTVLITGADSTPHLVSIAFTRDFPVSLAPPSVQLLPAKVPDVFHS